MTRSQPALWYARPAARGWQCEQPPDAVIAFHTSLPCYRPTALVELPDLATDLAVARVFVKDESFRLGLPAFKVLGASWAVARILAQRAGMSGALSLDMLRAAARSHPITLVTATDGNHGRALARVAALLGLPARVFVPEFLAGDAKASIAAEGAAVIVVSDTYDAAVVRAAASAANDHGAVLVQDTAWEGYEQIPRWIVQGYETLLAEVDVALDSTGCPGPDLVAVPVGVGSLAQAVLTHYRSGQRTAPSVLSVEPDSAACVLTSLSRGVLTTVATATTVMAGLNCGTPSSLAWPILHRGLDAAVAVTDTDAERARVDLCERGIQAGPSGAAALAGVRAALTGPAAAARRDDLGVDEHSVVVLLNTERGDPTR